MTGHGTHVSRRAIGLAFCFSDVDLDELWTGLKAGSFQLSVRYIFTR